MKRLLFISTLSIFLNSSCTSVQKYNEHIETKISVEDLQDDINYVEHKLNKLHPALHLYISKEELSGKFDSLRNAIKEPLTPNEFYLSISPVVASVKQGHMYIMPLFKRNDKKENKKLKKEGKHPLSLMEFKYIDDELYLMKNYTKDTLLKTGSKVISVQGIEPKKLYDKYKKTYTSDGFNKTFLSYAFAGRFSTYVMLENPIKDSVQVAFSYKDSLYARTITRAGFAKKDSLKTEKVKPVAKKLTKSEKEAQAIENKKIATRKKLFLYDDTTKEFVRSLSYIPSDSSIAVLKIKGFKNSKHKKAYDSIFNEIKKNEVKTLVLDLRNNGGGSLTEIQNIYSYLSPEPFVFIDTVRVTNRTGVATNKFRGVPNVGKVILSPFLLFNMTKTILSVKKDDKGEYYMKLKQGKLTEPKPNRFDGKVYVITNGGSFSASCVLSANLKNANRAVFVGEEAGGGYNETVAGTLPVLTLPKSKLKFRLGLQEVGPVKKTPEFGRGIHPDKVIIPTIEEFVENKDPEIEWIVADLKNSKK